MDETLYFDNGDSYVGQVKDGKPEGKGKYYVSMIVGAHNSDEGYVDGERLLYEGDFVDGKFEGKGVMYYDDGYRYEGDFHDNQPDGQGVLYDAQGDIDFAGEFIEGDALDE